MKTCKGCESEKPLTDYYSSTTSGDGRVSRCKVCTCAKLKAERAKKQPTWW